MEQSQPETYEAKDNRKISDSEYEKNMQHNAIFGALNDIDNRLDNIPLRLDVVDTGYLKTPSHDPINVFTQSEWTD